MLNTHTESLPGGTIPGTWLSICHAGVPVLLLLLLLPLQDQQLQWQGALQQLQQHSGNGGSTRVAQLSQQLQGLYGQLLSLPDPLPALKDAAALTAKTQGGSATTACLPCFTTHVSAHPCAPNRDLEGPAPKHQTQPQT